MIRQDASKQAGAWTRFSASGGIDPTVWEELGAGARNAMQRYVPTVYNTWTVQWTYGMRAVPSLAGNYHLSFCHA